MNKGRFGSVSYADAQYYKSSILTESMTMNLISKLRNIEMKADPTSEYIHAICC
jgi:hypothetical protein